MRRMAYLFTRDTGGIVSRIGASPDKNVHQPEEYMAWKKPRVVEISAAMEINCYVCAKV